MHHEDLALMVVVVVVVGVTIVVNDVEMGVPLGLVLPTNHGHPIPCLYPYLQPSLVEAN
jgi:hypothetical protein